MATITAFNTGRGYTEAGQRIAFIELPDRRAYFVDVDRHIYGIVAAPVFDDQPVNARYVLTEYDAGRYDCMDWEIHETNHAALCAEAARAV